MIPGYSDLVSIGRGGFSTVYRATQVAFGREVAIKVLDVGLDEAGRKRFERECLATGLVSKHPNVVTVFDAGETDDGHPFLILEFVPGGSLRDRMVRELTLEPAEAARLGAGVAAALAAAHSVGVMHRDVKPANVLLDEAGDPRLADFGISRVTSDPRYAGGSTRSYSPDHVAPEQFSGGAVTTATDVYALASMVFSLIEGRAPHSGGAEEDVHALLARKVSGVPPIWGDRIPAGMRWVLERAMAINPADRPTGEEMGEVLTGVSSGSTFRGTYGGGRSYIPPTPVLHPRVPEGDDSRDGERSSSDDAPPIDEQTRLAGGFDAGSTSFVPATPQDADGGSAGSDAFTAAGGDAGPPGIGTSDNVDHFGSALRVLELANNHLEDEVHAWLMGELAHLPKVVLPNEEIVVLSDGFFREAFGLFVVTTERFLFLPSGGVGEVVCLGVFATQPIVASAFHQENGQAALVLSVDGEPRVIGDVGDLWWAGELVGLIESAVRPAWRSGSA